MRRTKFKRAGYRHAKGVKAHGAKYHHGSRMHKKRKGTTINRYGSSRGGIRL